MSDSAAEAEAALAFAGARPVMHVATVGAQLRSLQDTAEAMCWAAGVTPTGRKLDQQDERPHADVLLLVSGSHPVRQLPMASQLLPGSVHMLQRAVQLKQQGVLPQQLELWAVANPVTEPDASYTEQKVNTWVLLDGCVGSCTARTAAAGWLLCPVKMEACSVHVSCGVGCSTLDYRSSRGSDLHTAVTGLVAVHQCDDVCTARMLIFLHVCVLCCAVLCCAAAFADGCWCAGHPHTAAARLACL